MEYLIRLEAILSMDRDHVGRQIKPIFGSKGIKNKIKNKGTYKMMDCQLKTDFLSIGY